MTLLNPSWLQSVRKVIAPGESLTYDEAYVELKNHMSQVTFDVDQMIGLASGLLLRTHDWQVCQFLMLACAAGGYLDDFLIALDAYAVILSHGKNAYPQSMKGRQACLLWLNKSAVVELLSQHKRSISAEWVSSCKASWKALQEHWKQDDEDEHLSWHTLGKWLESVRAQTPEREKKAHPEAVAPSHVHLTIEHAHQACDHAYKLWEYYFKEGKKLKAMCFSRAEAWSTVNIPHVQYGKTSLTPLRAADKQKLKQLYENNEWQALWDTAEQCFMQQAGPFDVALQFYIIEALKNLSEAKTLLWAECFFTTWLKAYPSLLDMQFNDGTPFCDEETRQWINTLMTPVVSVNETDHSFESIERSIRLKDASSHEWIQQFIPENHIDRLWQRYLCVLSDYVVQKSEAAWRGYHILFRLSDEMKLFSWEPNLMKKIWKLGLEISERMGVKYDQNNSTGMRDNLINHIIQHDVLFAKQVSPLHR